MLKPTAVVLVVGFAYYYFHKLTGLAVFCPFRRFLGVYCPGCGVSRMLLYLSRWRIPQAFSANCVLFCLLPVAVIWAGYHAYRYIRYGDRKLKKAENIAIYVVIGILVVFGVVRNLWPIDILVPN